MPTRITDSKKDIAIINRKLLDLSDLKTTVSAVQANVATLQGIPVRTGQGSPEGTVQAPVGTIFVRTDGTAGATLYIKETGGAGMNGWVPK